MLRTRTLLILGAGASFPYGYPLGKKLINCILGDMNDEILIPMVAKTASYSIECEFSKIKPIFSHIVESGLSKRYPLVQERDETYTSRELRDKNQRLLRFVKMKIIKIDMFKKLHDALIDFDPISIDAFLRDNPSHAEAGKIMIIYSLLKREQQDKFTLQKNSDNWYSLFLNDLISECSDDPNKLLLNQIRITTFNYDLSLDFYLQSKLNKVEVFSKKENNTTLSEQFLKNLKIKHVYGKMYNLDEISYGDYAGRILRQDPDGPTYHNDLTPNFERFIFAFNKYENIKTMYDERNFVGMKEEIAINKKDLIWAEEIIFIGFGFDRDNLNMLGIPDNLQGYNEVLPVKTIRYLNYKGEMRSLSQEFKTLERICRIDNNSKGVTIIQSDADTICSAYQNDFKKYLFK
ncbi:MAG: hypothetical protein HYX61_04200 [Gammaproteobacteria bacterium]|jgi:hypothetical protein|nr:hypothetical protein [Gammaproteobacteria bacterium]